MNNEEQKVTTAGEQPMILADNLVKIYKTKDLEVLALQGLDLTVNKGELVAIIGTSGSGKSTFLNMLGGLDRPSAGKLFVDGKNLFKLSDRELVDYKRQTVGFVWQNNARNLLPYLTAYENIMTPMLLSSQKAKRERTLELLDLVGMSHRKNNKLHQLSGGEQQRIAIAIALANNPKLLLADEPTGSVDRKTADYILDMFRSINRETGVTIVIVTHDVDLSKKMPRVVSIRDGKISSERTLKEQYVVDLSNQKLDWQNQDETQDEFAIVDRAGRIQIPREILDTLSLDENKVKMHFKDGQIIITKPE